jgi:hypothetical protein
MGLDALAAMAASLTCGVGAGAGFEIRCELRAVRTHGASLDPQVYRSLGLVTRTTAVLGLDSHWEGDLISDGEKIRRLIEDVYVRALSVMPSRHAPSQEFHPCFRVLLPVVDGCTSPCRGASWETWGVLRGSNPKALEEAARLEFPFIVIAGDAAIAKVIVLNRDQPVYTEFVSLPGRGCMEDCVQAVPFPPSCRGLRLIRATTRSMICGERASHSSRQTTCLPFLSASQHAIGRSHVTESAADRTGH